MSYRCELMQTRRDTVFRAMDMAEAACIELRNIIYSEGGYPVSSDEAPLLRAAVHVQ